MTVLDAFHLAVFDDGQLVRRAAAGDERHNLRGDSMTSRRARVRACDQLALAA